MTFNRWHDVEQLSLHKAKFDVHNDLTETSSNVDKAARSSGCNELLCARGQSCNGAVLLVTSKKFEVKSATVIHFECTL